MSYLLPIGPWHPALDEPVLYKLEVAGSKIEKVELELGFNHRGAEALLSCLPLHRILAPVAQLCGKCSYANTLAVGLALENLAGITPPLRASYLRTIAAELERAVSHLTNSAKVLRMLGLNLLGARLEEEAEGVRQLLAATGNRVYDTLNFMGGTMRNLHFPLEFQSAVERLRKNVYESVNQVLDNPQLENRAAETGIIEPLVADELGLVGPIGRASDIPVDARRSDPYAAYGELDFRVVTQSNGSLFARLAVRLLEALESLNIVSQALQRLPDGEFKQKELPPRFDANSEASAVVESPRGALLCYVASDKQGQLHRLRLRPPTMINLPALELAMTGQDLDDALALLVSLDFCFACGER